MSLTKERLKEIRELSEIGKHLGNDKSHVEELLAEIARLRDENTYQRKTHNEWLSGQSDRFEFLKEERDQLREKLAVALFALVTSYDFIERIRARVSLVEPFYTLSGKTKMTVEEALAKIRKD